MLTNIIILNNEIMKADGLIIPECDADKENEDGESEEDDADESKDEPKEAPKTAEEN